MLRHRYRIIRSLFVLWMVVPLSLTYAQGTGFSDNFDDPALPGWDHSPRVFADEGILHIEAGNFAVIHGEWGADYTLTTTLRSYGQGDFFLNFNTSESGAYHLIFGQEFIRLDREAGGQVIELGTSQHSHHEAAWYIVTLMASGGNFRVALNDETVLEANDPNPLPPGGISFEALEAGELQLDELSITFDEGVTSHTEAISSSDEEALPATSDLSSQAENWIRLGGPPGGLGYDIRFNFADPNTWYVTDNFAGVHVSADNGLSWLPSNVGIPGQGGVTGDAIPIFSLTVDPHNPQILWAGTDWSGHVYKSVDGGLTWEQKDYGITIEYGGLSFRGFTVDPRSSDIVYAMGETHDAITGGAVWGMGTGGVVYKTVDGGEHWDVLWDGGIPSSLARYLWVDPRDPNILYVSTGIFDRGAVGESANPEMDEEPFGGLGVLKSNDGGQTWRVLGKENGLDMLYIGSLFMHPAKPDILLAAAGHLIPGPAAEHLIRNELSPAGIYRTTNGGENWTQVLIPPLDRVGEAFTSVELCPSDPNIGYAGSELAVYRTEDAGLTWELVAGGTDGWGPPGVVTGWPIDMQCDPRDTNRVFANNYNGGNFLSEDGGRTWVNASRGYTGAQVIRVAIDASDSARIYAAGRSGPWSSADGGTSWQGAFYLVDSEGVPGLEWMTIAADPARQGHLLGGHGAMLESDDGGQSWHVRTSVEQIGGEGAFSTILFAPSNPTIVYAGIAGDGCIRMREPTPCDVGFGVVVSRDGGRNWQRAIDAVLDELPVYDVAVSPDDAKQVYAATEDGLYKSLNGGETWEKLDQLPSGDRVRAVSVSPAESHKVIAAVEPTGIYLSADGGETWVQATAGLEPNSAIHDIEFDPQNPQVIYISDTLSGIYRSNDGGHHWLKINQGLSNRAVLGLAISHDGQLIYVGTDGGGVFRLDLNGIAP